MACFCFFCLEIINGKNGQRANRDEITVSTVPAPVIIQPAQSLCPSVRTTSWSDRVCERAERSQKRTKTHFLPLSTQYNLSTHTPCIDLQCGLQYLGSLLSSAGQLLGAEEVACGAHFQHCDHGRVGVQTRRQLKCQRRKLTTAHGGNKETFKSVSQGA